MTDQAQSGSAAERLALAIAISSLLHNISNRMTATGTATYAQFGLGLLDARILYVLPRSPPMPASKLSNRLDVHPAAISRSVNRLLDDGLLARGPNGERILVLTEAGLAVSETITAVFEERCLRLVADLPTDALKPLQKRLGQLQGSLGSIAALSEETGAAEAPAGPASGWPRPR